MFQPDTQTCKDDEVLLYNLWRLMLVIAIFNWLFYGFIWLLIAVLAVIFFAFLRRQRMTVSQAVRAVIESLRQNEQISRHAGGIIERMEETQKRFSGLGAAAKDTKECVICCEEFKEDSMVTQLNCFEKHVFHTACVQEWMKKKTVCPICRKEANPV